MFFCLSEKLWWQRLFHVIGVTGHHEVLVWPGKISKGHSHWDVTNTGGEVSYLQHSQKLNISFQGWSFHQKWWAPPWTPPNINWPCNLQFCPWAHYWGLAIIYTKDSTNTGRLMGACCVSYLQYPRHAQASSEVVSEMIEQWSKEGMSWSI